MCRDKTKGTYMRTHRIQGLIIIFVFMFIHLFAQAMVTDTPKWFRSMMNMHNMTSGEPYSNDTPDFIMGIKEGLSIKGITYNAIKFLETDEISFLADSYTRGFELGTININGNWSRSDIKGSYRFEQDGVTLNFEEFSFLLKGNPQDHSAQIYKVGKAGRKTKTQNKLISLIVNEEIITKGDDRSPPKIPSVSRFSIPMKIDGKMVEAVQILPGDIQYGMSDRLIRFGIFENNRFKSLFSGRYHRNNGTTYYSLYRQHDGPEKQIQVQVGRKKIMTDAENGLVFSLLYEHANKNPKGAGNVKLPADFDLIRQTVEVQISYQFPTPSSSVLMCGKFLNSN